MTFEQVSFYSSLSNRSVSSFPFIPPFPTLRYVENGSLLNLMKTFTVIPESLCVKYISQVLRGLQYLHEKGVVHCDLKVCISATTSGTFVVSLFTHYRNAIFY